MAAGRGCLHHAAETAPFDVWGFARRKPFRSMPRTEGCRLPSDDAARRLSLGVQPGHARGANAFCRAGHAFLASGRLMVTMRPSVLLRSKLGGKRLRLTFLSNRIGLQFATPLIGATGAVVLRMSQPPFRYIGRGTHLAEANHRRSGPPARIGSRARAAGRGTSAALG